MSTQKKSICTYIEHGLSPHKRFSRDFEAMSLLELSPCWDRPFIAMVDGKAVLRSDWEITIYRGHSVVFIDACAIPQGGGSNPLRILATLAVVALSYGAGSWAGGLFMGKTASSFASAIASGAVLVGGMAIVNAVLPPEVSSVSGAKSIESASPTYSLQGQGNYARLEQAIPEHFGRCIAYPDFAAQPYTEARGNEIYLYQLFALTRGYCSVEELRIEDTLINNFSNVEYEIIEPHGQVTLFPTSVEVSSEVSGQELENATTVGPYTAVGENEEAHYIGVDFVAAKGLFYANDDGSLSSVQISVRIEKRKIDENGAAIGDWETLGVVTYKAATTTPQRYSEKFPVAPGRYEIQCTRITAKHGSTRYGHDIAWSGLRAYMADTTDFGDVTLLAITMQASSQLSSMASRKINAIITRKLPVLTEIGWSAPTETRSIAWAAAYCCKQVGIADANIDLAGLLSLDSVWSSTGDHCDGRIDSFIPFWDALSKICNAGRCKPFIQNGMVRFHRDQQQVLPVALFSMQNMVRNSFKVNYLQPTEDTADAVEVLYFDADVWRQRRVMCTLADSTDDKPAKAEISFVTNRERAHAYGLYLAASNQRRRKIISFSTEMDGFIPSYGDLVLVQHDMPAWGQSGECIGVSTGSPTVIATSEPITWTAGATHYVAFSTVDGSVRGPFEAQAVQGDDHAIAVAAVDLDGFVPYVGMEMERCRYSFGPGDAWTQPAIVISVKPRSMHLVDIECVNEDNSVHTADQGVMTPPPVTSQLGNFVSNPVVSGLTAVTSPTDKTKILISWTPSPWADHYLVEVSSDGETWTRVGETMTTNITIDAIYGDDTIIRVAAVGTGRGPWVTVAYGSISITEWDGSLVGFSASLDGSSIKLSWSIFSIWNVTGYEVRRGTDWESASVITTGIASNSCTYTPGPGNHDFLLKAIDKFGKYSTSTASTSLDVTAPSLQSLTRQVAGYAVTLSWTEIVGTFPIQHAEIRKGNKWATGDVVGKTISNYLTLTERYAGTFIFWVRLADTAGNTSAAFKVSATLNPGADIVSELEGMLTYQQLNASLGERIDLIDGNGAGSVNARVLDEAEARAQAIIDEASARSGADSALQSQIDILTAASTGDLQDLIAAVETETTARVTADNAESAARQTLATQLRGSYTGTNINSLTSGLIYGERVARSTADSSLAQSISTLEASLEGQLATKASISSVETAFADEETARTTAIDEAVSRITNSTGIFSDQWEGSDVLQGWTVYGNTTAEVSSIESTQSSFGGKLLVVGNNADNDQLRIISNQNIPFDPEKTYKSQIRVKRYLGDGTVFAGFVGVAADGITLINTAGADTFMNQHYHCVSGNLPALGAWQTFTGYTHGQGASETSGVGTLSDPKKMYTGVRYIRPMLLVNYSGQPGKYYIDYIRVVEGGEDELSAAILEETNTRVSGDNALSEQLAVLSATVTSNHTTNTAAIQTEQTARANADQSLASSITTVQAVANAKNKTYRQASAPTSGMIAGDIWYDSDNSNKPYRYSGTGWVATADTRIDANTAAIQTEQTARANADQSLASSITTVQAVANAKNKTYRQASAPTSGMIAGDIWYDSDNSNKPYRYSGTGWVATADTRIDANTAAIQTEATVRASETGDLFAQYTVKLDVGGKVSGFGLASSDPTESGSVFDVRADKIAFSPPLGSPGNNVAPFVYDAATGSMAVDGAKIKRLSVDTLQIAGRAVTVPVIASYSSSVLIPTNEYVQLIGIEAETFGSSPAYIDIFARLNRTGVLYGNDHAHVYMKVYRGATLIAGSDADTLVLGVPIEMEYTYIANIVSTTTVSGTHTYSIHVKARYDDTYISRTTVRFNEFKK